MVYSRAETVGRTSGGLLNKMQRLGRRQEAGSPREKNGKVEQDTDEGVPMVADLKRLDAEGSLSVPAGNCRHALD